MIRLFKGENGASLVATLVALGIGSVITLTMSESLLNSLKFQKHIELRGNREAVRMSIVNKVSCKDSFSENKRKNCSSGKLLDLSYTDDNGNENIIISKGDAVRRADGIRIWSNRS